MSHKDGLDIANSGVVDKVQGGLVADGGTKKQIQGVYVADGGTVKKVFDADRFHQIEERLTINETEELEGQRNLSDTDAVELSESVEKYVQSRQTLKKIQENLSISETSTLTKTIGLSDTDNVSLTETLRKLEESRQTLKKLQEDLSISETDTLDVTVNLGTDTDSVTLDETLRKLETNDGPLNLSVSWNATACGFDLSWDPDTVNSQDIYRCSGSSCNPSQDGGIIDTVSAGTDSYQDTGPGEQSGDYSYEIVSSAGSSNVDSDTAGLCTN